MKKTTKTKTQSTLIITALCCLIGGTFFATDKTVEVSAEANAATYEIAGNETKITLLDGASIRYVSEEESAIRFSVSVENWVENVSYGIIVAKYTDSFDETKFTHAGSYTYMDLNSSETEFKSIETETGRTFSLVITGITEEDFRFNFAAKAYVQDGTTYTYTDFTETQNVRSVAQVSAMALKNNDEIIDEENVGLFLNYAGMGDAVNVGAKKISWQKVYGVSGYEVVEGNNQAETISADSTEYTVKGVYSAGDKVVVSVRPLFEENNSIAATTVSLSYGMILLNGENSGIYDIKNLNKSGNVALVQNAQYTVYGKNAIYMNSSGVWNYFRFPAVNLGTTLSADRYLQYDIYNPNEQTLEYGVNSHYGSQAKNGFTTVSIPLNALVNYAVQNADGTYSLRTGESGNRYFINLPKGQSTAGEHNTSVEGKVELYFSGFRISSEATAFTLSLGSYEETVECLDATMAYTLPLCTNGNYTVSVQENGVPISVVDNMITATKGKTYQIVYSATNVYGVQAQKTIEVSFVGKLPTIMLTEKSFISTDANFTVPTPTTTDTTSLTWKLFASDGTEVGISSSVTYEQLANGLYSLVYTATNGDGEVSQTATLLVAAQETLVITASKMVENAVCQGGISVEENAKSNGYALFETQAVKVVGTGVAWTNLFRFPKIHLGSSTGADKYFVFDVYNPTNADVQFYYNSGATIGTAKPGFTRIAMSTNQLRATITENGNVYIWNETAGSRHYIAVNVNATLYFSGFRISDNAYADCVQLADYERLYLMTADTAEYTLPLCSNEGYTVSVKQGENAVPVSENKISVQPSKTYSITYLVANSYGLNTYQKTITIQTTEVLMGETLVTDSADIVANTPSRNPVTDSSTGKIGVYENAYAEGFAKYEQTALRIFSNAPNIYIRLPKIALGNDLSETRYFVFDVYNPQETNVTMAGISGMSLAPGWNTVKIKLSDLTNKSTLEDGVYYLWTETPADKQSYLGINVNVNHNSSYVGTGVTLYFSGFRVTNQE